MTAETASTQPPIVAIVDDDDGVRDSLHLLLESAGLRCEVFPSGEVFLPRADEQAWACLLLDVHMPGASGLEIQDRLTARGSAIPVIMMTAHGEVPIAVRAMKAGAVDFVEKPLDGDLLLESIGRALALGERTRNEKEMSLRTADRIAALTPREKEVLEALVAGKPNKVIAHQLGISPRTVEIHRARVMEKMQAHSLSELVRMTLAASPHAGR